MKILVCGGRDYSDQRRLFRELDNLHKIERIDQVFEGGANGADAMARTWALTNDIPVQTYFADWRTYGRGAGPIRNRQMLDENPDIGLVVAFPGGRGTADMVALARRRGIEVREVPV